MTKTKKLIVSGVLVAVGVVGSLFHIPIGVIKLSPVQHMVNVISGVILGPWYSVGSAFTTSLLRIMLGLGSPLAFPGSMIGALLCGIAYKASKSKILAICGEVLGTGFIGALVAYPTAKYFLGKTIALTVLIPSFGLSTLVGAGLSLIILETTERLLHSPQEYSKSNLDKEKQ